MSQRNKRTQRRFLFLMFLKKLFSEKLWKMLLLYMTALSSIPPFATTLTRNDSYKLKIYFMLNYKSKTSGYLSVNFGLQSRAQSSHIRLHSYWIPILLKGGWDSRLDGLWSYRMWNRDYWESPHKLKTTLDFFASTYRWSRFLQTFICVKIMDISQ